MSCRVVIDTNVIISSVLSQGGKPDQLFQAVFDGHLQLILSYNIIKETRRVFSYTKIKKLLKKRKISIEEIEDYLVKLIRISILVDPATRLDVIKDDPADNNILAAAMYGQADVIISGDQHLLSLKSYMDIKVLTPSEFIEKLKEAG